MKLYRPVGVAELRLIAELDWQGYPPRLPGQPIFYPVLEHDYAIQIARDWNVVDEASGYAGFVTAFEITAECASRYEVQAVGSTQHRELWVPAEELDKFNASIVGSIQVQEAFYGDAYEGDQPPIDLPGAR